MAWIEAVMGELINLDCIRVMNIRLKDDRHMAVIGNDGRNDYALAEIEGDFARPLFDKPKCRDRVINGKEHKRGESILVGTMWNIAGLARGNTLIRQDDIREMIKKADGQT